jgi:hypothetical protein
MQVAKANRGEKWLINKQIITWDTYGSPISLEMGFLLFHVEKLQSWALAATTWLLFSIQFNFPNMLQ